jgi:hypothetical protein
MKKIVLAVILLSPFLLLSYIKFGDSLKYPDEIKLAYDYVDPISQKTIKNRKVAQVEEFTPRFDIEIMNEETDSLTNIKGIDVMTVTFKTDDDGSLGPIIVYIDKNSKKVLGIGGRK